MKPTALPANAVQTVSNRVAVYGIAHCDTIKKARAWLHAQGVDHTFHDYKKSGVPQPQLAGWVQSVGWAALINRKGSTWRTLGAADQAAVCDAASACALLCAHPSVIRRPVVEHAGGLLVGFDAVAWRRVWAGNPANEQAGH
jgi:arsenate reductase (glutaredoxin)